MFKTHVGFGLLTALLSLRFINPPSTPVFVAIVLVGSILPDIDESDSKIGKRLVLFSKPADIVFGHRGFFHSLFPPLMLYIAFSHIMGLNVLGIGLALGYLSHLAIDSLNIFGIVPLRPLYNRKVSGFIRTNSLTEYLLFLLIAFLDVYLLKNVF